MLEKEEAISQVDYRKVLAKVFQASIFVFIAILAPYFLNQFLTGTIINAMLFIAVVMVGIEYAFFLCLIPSLVSIYTGLLPIVLAPMIPFIIMGNIILVLIFNKFYKKNFWLGAVPASLAKFIFIWCLGMILASSILSGIASKLMLMASWPQLATALMGAVIAYIFLRIVKKI